MKCISMYQPWASLWLTDNKLHETRPKRFNYRGWTLVHATIHVERDIEADLAGIVVEEFGPRWSLELPRGAIIGAVNVIDCHHSSDLVRRWRGPDGGPVRMAHWRDYICGNYAPLRYGIERAPEVKKFSKPIPYKGMQAVPFEVPDEVVREAMAT